MSRRRRKPKLVDPEPTTTTTTEAPATTTTSTTPEPTFTLTVDLDGGAIGSEEGPIVITGIASGTTISTAFSDFGVNDPVKSGEVFVEYVFDGTSDEVLGTEQITSNTTIVATYLPE